VQNTADGGGSGETNSNGGQDHTVTLHMGLSNRVAPSNNAAAATSTSNGVGASSAKDVGDSPQEIQAYLSDAWKGEAGNQFRALHGLPNVGDKLPRPHPSPSDLGSGNGEKTVQEVPPQPSFLRLTALFTYRGLLQYWRSLGTIQLELFMHVLAGLCIGMAFVNENWFIPPINSNYLPYCPGPMATTCAQEAVRDVINLMVTYTVMALGLVSGIIGNRTYGQELTNMRRESEAGLSLAAYFLGKALAELPLIVLYSFFYSVAYFLVASPSASFDTFYTVILLFEFVCFGIGYVSSVLFQGENALLCSAVSTLLGGLATENTSMEQNACWARWTAEALFIAEARIDLLEHPLDKHVQNYMDGRNGFSTDNYAIDLIVLLLYGLLLRVMAFGIMKWKLRK